MLKKLVLFVLLAVVMSTTVVHVPSVAQANSGTDTKARIVSGVSFRDKPSTSSTVLRTLRTGEIVTVLQAVNPSWYQIQDANGRIGFVSSNEKFITIISNAVIVANVNLRPAPTTDSTRIRLMQAGEAVLVLEKMNDSWYRIKDANGVEGFTSTSSKFIDVNFSVTSVIMPLTDRIEAVIDAASAYLGTPYEFGSTRLDTTTFDCSDLVQQAFWDSLKTLLPSDSRGQGDLVRSLGNDTTNLSNLKRGDLLFFMSYKGFRESDYAGVDKSTETITHVGIYLGNGQMLHTFSVDSGGVRIDNLFGTTWQYRLLFGGSAMN